MMLLYQRREIHAPGEESEICLSSGEFGKWLQLVGLIWMWEAMIKNEHKSSTENTNKNASAFCWLSFSLL